MTNEEILKKAIEKAVKNGYDDNQYQRGVGCMLGMFLANHPEIFIFSHDFAKAFWGDRELKEQCQSYGVIPPVLIPVWQYHLIQMVLEPEPLKYIERFLQ